jgi:pimeloyl-ACP methyl ester carboxylesterase
MKSLEIRSYHVLGWSLGGHIGIEMWFADDAVRSLMITGTPPVRLSREGAAEGFLTSPVMDLAGKETFSKEDVRLYGSAMLGEEPDPSLPIGQCIARTDGAARRLMVENGFAGIGQDEVHAVAACPKPLAIVQGEKDPFVNLSYLKDLTYRNLWLKKPIIVDGGHAPHWERPTEFNCHLGEFLEELTCP